MASSSLLLRLACCAFLVSACTSNAGTTSGWATKLLPAPDGLTLDPPPPNDLYWIAFASADIPARTKGGQLWDEVGGWPDPIAKLFVDGKEAMRAPVVTDRLKPIWKSPHGNLQIDPGSTLRVELEDEDAVRNLPIGHAESGPPALADLSEGMMRFDLGSRTELVLKVEAAHGMLGLGFDYSFVAGITLIKKVMRHSPAGRAGVRVGDQIVSIGDRRLDGLKSRAVRSAVNSIGSIPTTFIVKHQDGPTEALKINVGPIYPLYAEYGEID